MYSSGPQYLNLINHPYTLSTQIFWPHIQNGIDNYTIYRIIVKLLPIQTIHTKTVANILLPITHNLFIIASVNFLTTGIVPWNLSNKIMKFLQKTHTTCYFRTHQGWTESHTTTVCCGWTSTIYLQYIQMSITLWACMTSHKGAFTLDTLRPEETMPLMVP